jgi:Flp pilus assembly pilin Flp
MKQFEVFTDRLQKFIRDKQGAEVTELAIVLALIVAGSVILLVSIGGKLLSSYTTFNGTLP